MGEKGQIVIPKQAREQFGIKQGDSLMLFGDAERGIAVLPKVMYAELLNKFFEEKEPDET